MLLFPVLIAVFLIGAATSETTFCRSRPLFARHLRQGPPAILLSTLVAWGTTHAVLIHESREQIRHYVHSGANPVESPEFHLHIVFPSFCGNANAEECYWLYGATAAEGIGDRDPAVRARSIQALFAVHVLLAGDGSGPYEDMLEQASRDPDPLIQRVIRDRLSGANRWPLSRRP
jgi:hypothetical protein